MHIFLTGFMGCGKSAVGRALSELSGARLFDADSYIEKKDGRPISRIFEESGEGYFRRLESNVLYELKEKSGYIVSCGGGMVLRDENVNIMKSCGKIVYLLASPGVILERVSRSDKRPILEGNKNIDFITSLMEKRTPFYEKAADITIDTENMELKDVASAILGEIQDFVVFGQN